MPIKILDPQMQEVADALKINPNSPDGRYMSDKERIDRMTHAAAYYEMFGRPLVRTEMEEFKCRRTNLITGEVIQDTL